MKKALFASLWIAIIFLGVKWSPFDYVMEAGPAAYYQARVAYFRGNAKQQQDIASSYADQKITLHEYSKYVFPAYVMTSVSGEEVFPMREQSKSVQKLHDELKKMIGKHN